MNLSKLSSALALVLLMVFSSCASAQVLESLKPNLVNYYSFDNPKDGDPKSPIEVDQGLDKTDITLVNGAPRVEDGAWPGSKYAIETGQKDGKPNDDWKAGVMFKSSAESTLKGSQHVTGVTIMGFFKPLGTAEDNPTFNTDTPNPTDRYNAIGLAGILRGDEGADGLDGHGVRALLEVIRGKVTGLGRRIDNQPGSGTRESVEPWAVVMPPNEWTHLAAAFDFDSGTITLYKNGKTLDSTPPATTNWRTTNGTDYTSNTAAGGIKIGGSYPDNSKEFNTFNGRFDELMFFDKTLTAEEVEAQFKQFTPAAAPAASRN